MTATSRILVLDDNVDVAQGVADILELSGYDCNLVHDGESAVAAFQNGNFDLGLFDIRMPRMNGVEAFFAIRKANPNARIVLMSGYADEKLVAEAMKGGAIGFLSKPFDPEAMLELLQQLATPAAAE